MMPRHEMTKEHYQRILAKAGKAMERRKVAKGKVEKERSSWWWATWMHATGIGKFGTGEILPKTGTKLPNVR